MDPSWRHFNSTQATLSNAATRYSFRFWGPNPANLLPVVLRPKLPNHSKSRICYTSSMMSTCAPLILDCPNTKCSCPCLDLVNRRLDFGQHHLHLHPHMYTCLSTSPYVRHPRYILQFSVPRTKPAGPSFTAPGPSRMDSLNLLHYHQPSQRSALAHHKTRDMLYIHITHAMVSLNTLNQSSTTSWHNHSLLTNMDTYPPCVRTCIDKCVDVYRRITSCDS